MATSADSNLYRAMPDSISTLSGDSSEAFLSQVMEQQRSLYAYILNLTQSLSDADDVLQEVNLVLWRKRDEFQPGSNFQAWAFAIARFQVLAWQKRQARERVRFGDELVEQLAAAAADRMPALDERRVALAGCIEQLRDRERTLLRQRYGEGLSTQQISDQDGRTRDGIYYALSKVHEKLRDCIRRRIAEDNA